MRRNSGARLTACVPAPSGQTLTKCPTICTLFCVPSSKSRFVSGQLAVKDLLQAWNERSHALLGIEPATPREGVLQDVHWATGMFGYFPTYTIGSLYAAQLTEAYAKIRPLTEEIRGARFAGLSDWLEKNIYGVGNRFTAEETVIRATGTGLDTAAFFRHVESPERAWNSFQTQ